MSKPHEDFYARFIKFIYGSVVVTVLMCTFVVLLIR